MSLFTSDFTMQSIDSEQVGLANKVREIAALPEDTLEQQVIKQHRWEDLMCSPRVVCLRLACDIYTYAFYKQFTASDIESHVDESGKFTAFNIPYTRTVYQALQEIKCLVTILTMSRMSSICPTRYVVKRLTLPQLTVIFTGA